MLGQEILHDLHYLARRAKDQGMALVGDHMQLAVGEGRVHLFRQLYGEDGVVRAVDDADR